MSNVSPRFGIVFRYMVLIKDDENDGLASINEHAWESTYDN